VKKEVSEQKKKTGGLINPSNWAQFLWSFGRSPWALMMEYDCCCTHLAMCSLGTGMHRIAFSLSLLKHGHCHKDGLVVRPHLFHLSTTPSLTACIALHSLSLSLFTLSAPDCHSSHSTYPLPPHSSRLDSTLILANSTSLPFSFIRSLALTLPHLQILFFYHESWTLVRSGVDPSSRLLRPPSPPPKTPSPLWHPHKNHLSLPMSTLSSVHFV